MAYFKKGDYIVLTGFPRTIEGGYFKEDTRAFKMNYVYKQRESIYYFAPEEDCKGSDKNGWSCYDFHYDNWRFATDIEIDAYNKAGKPVTILNIKIDNYSII